MSTHPDGVAYYADAEDRAGVEHIMELAAEREAVVAKLAPLFGEYGMGGTAERTISAERSRIAEMIRAMAAADGKKMTEAALEDSSKQHKEYLDKIAKQTTERAEFFRLQERLRVIDYRINRGQAVIRMYSSEPK